MTGLSLRNWRRASMVGPASSIAPGHWLSPMMARGLVAGVRSSICLSLRCDEVQDSDVLHVHSRIAHLARGWKIFVEFARGLGCVLGTVGRFEARASRHHDVQDEIHWVLAPIRGKCLPPSPSAV